MKKKALSFLLVIAILISTFTVGFGSIVVNAEEPEVYFYVPEAAYLTPTDKTGNQPIQWYLNSYRSNTTQSWALPKENVGKLFFYCPSATSVSISVSGAAVSNLTTTGTNKIDSNSFTMEAPNVNGGIVTWTATYVVNGTTRTTNSYTYVYKPNRIPTGVAGETESAKHGSNNKYDYMGLVLALWGSHRYDAATDDGNQKAKGPSEMIFLGNDGMTTGSNARPHNCGYFDDNNPKTFRYHDNNNINVTVSSPYCYYYVDGSRFTDINSVPNFKMGLASTDDQHTDYHECSVDLQTADGNEVSTPFPLYRVETETIFIKESDNLAPSYLMKYIPDGTSSDFRLRLYGRSYCGGTVTHLDGYLYFQINNTNKSNLRNTYLNNIKQGALRQSSRYTSSSWRTYENAMKNAASVLGNPAAPYSTVISAVVTLNSAVDNLVCNHSYSYAVTVPATCTETGIGTYTCQWCGDSYTEEITKTAHSTVDTIIEPTCTTRGYTQHTCSVCGVTTTDTYTSMLGHSWNSGEITVQATCTADGVKTYTCTRCSSTKTEIVAKLGHYYSKTTITPTCTKSGYTEYQCTRCDSTYKDGYVQPKGHTPAAEWTVLISPTCDEDGIKVKNCTVCGAMTNTEVIPADGSHVYGEAEWSWKGTSSATAKFVCTKCYADSVQTAVISEKVTLTPTCTDEGAKTYTAKVNFGGTEYTDAKTTKIEAPGHTEGDWEEIVPPTYDEEGLKTKKCTVCGETLLTEKIDKLEREVVFEPEIDTATVIDDENKIIYGLEEGVTDLEGFVAYKGCELVYHETAAGFGTGTTVDVVCKGEVIDTYTIVIFGDVTGDGYVDSFDAAILISVSNFEIEIDEDSAYYFAADLTNDGFIDSFDSAQLIAASNFEMEILQTR